MITDPQAVRFANEQLRPLCEDARALKARIEAATTLWFSGLNASFPNNSTVLDDGREAEGVSRLTGAAANSAMGILIAAASAVNNEIVAKPCVRPLPAS